MTLLRKLGMIYDKTSNLAVVIFFLLQTILHVQAMEEGGGQAKDAFARMQYKSAFDQKLVYEKHRKLLEDLGCAKNVFLADKKINFATKSPYQSDHENSSLLSDFELDELECQSKSSDYFKTNIPGEQAIDNGIELELYERDCLANLNYARRMALAEPVIHALTRIAFSATGTVLAIQVLGKESMGGSFATYGSIFNILHCLQGTIKSGYNLVSWPDNVLDDLEDHFAKNKCYIPSALWPKITKSFISARQNEFTRDPHINFISFAVGFTTYKPKPSVKFKDDLSIDDVKIELHERIDSFFKDYASQDISYVNYIKINVSKFVDLLVSHRKQTIVQAPRYIYLHGSGGIGKTHFVQKLSEWIDELIPESVRFENIVINCADELEGTVDRPGVMLKVLRNQLIENKRGSVLIIDEATWLNDKGMVSSAKRIFNGDLSKLSTSYFGSNMDGSGVSLEIPPVLTFVASNDKIQDPALESRFDTVEYPSPTQAALIIHACFTASQSRNIQQGNSSSTKKIIADWVKDLQPSQQNFRYVAGNVEAFILKMIAK